MSSAVEGALDSLIYRSTASRPLSKSDLERILAGARKRNSEEHITGILLFVGGKFMQYLEGPKEGLKKIFELIQHSSLHKEIVDVEWGRTSARVYTDWSMAFLADAAGDAASNQESAQLASIMQQQIGGDSSFAFSKLSKFRDEKSD